MNRTEQHDTDTQPNDAAAHALRHLQTQTTTVGQSRAAQQLARAEGWQLWRLGGFQLTDGSVLRCAASQWQRLSADQACSEQSEREHDALDIRLLHTYEGQGGREKSSVSEAHFEYLAPANRWRLVVDYEAYMDSPLYGFASEGADALLDLDLLNLLIDTPGPSGRARLQEVALHLDWLELLCVSRRPEEVVMDTS